MPSPSFACADFISTTATIATNYKPNLHKTIGIYAEVFLAQGTAQSSYFLVIPTKSDAGTINTFGVHIFKTTSLAIAILAAAPEHQSGKFIFLTFIDDNGVDGVGWSQRASAACVAVIGIFLTQYTLTGTSHKDSSKRAYDRVYHNAAISGPIDIIVAFNVSAVPGRFFILGLLFSIHDYETMFTSPMGQPVTQIIFDMIGKKGVAERKRWGIGVAEPVAMSEKSEFLEKSTAANDDES
ncbi:hypothetical protein V8E52_006648 [Russula decolorans]